jgi:hypothetical protein
MFRLDFAYLVPPQEQRSWNFFGGISHFNIFISPNNEMYCEFYQSEEILTSQILRIGRFQEHCRRANNNLNNLFLQCFSPASWIVIFKYPVTYIIISIVYISVASNVIRLRWNRLRLSEWHTRWHCNLIRCGLAWKRPTTKSWWMPSV